MNKHIIRLKQPASQWDEGLPIGNGRIGAMITGSPDDETITLNEETIWYGPERNRKNPDTKIHIEKIRELLLEGETEKAEFLAKMAMTSTPKYLNPYQPAGELRISFPYDKHEASEYERVLDIDEALACVRYQRGTVRYEKEYFSSHAYQVIAIRISSDKKESERLTFGVNMNRKPFEEKTGKIDDKTVYNCGSCGKDGINYYTAVRLVAKDGSVSTIGDFVCVTEATEAYIYVAMGTDYETELDVAKTCIGRLDKAESAGFSEIKRVHHVEFKALYGRLDFSIYEGEIPEFGTDELLKEFGGELKKYLPYLVETLFHYARYLMIASSYDCLLPSNLQGIWNGDYVPAWQSEFTININTEMNYWIAEKSNLSECHLPLFKQLKRMLPRGQKTAKELYGCEGFCAHHNTNLWGNTDPEGIMSASPFWPMGGAWLALHLLEHYDFTGDEQFLREEALPLIEESILFFKGYLYENEQGELLTGPSVSPENSYYSNIGAVGALCMGPSSDIQILRELLKGYMEVCERSGMTDGIYKDAEYLLRKLPESKLTKDGRLREWQEDYEEVEPGHRHMSHLFALHPGTAITQDQEELYEAAKNTLNHRLKYGGGQTGWSRAWVTCFFARLKDDKSVEDSIKKMLATCIKTNLLDTHPPFQIDGNFGFSEAVFECIVQSHGGYIELLPALPDFMKKKGHLTGMKLRGNTMADIMWEDGKIIRLHLTPSVDKTVEIRCGVVKIHRELRANVVDKIPIDILFVNEEG